MHGEFAHGGKYYISFVSQLIGDHMKKEYQDKIDEYLLLHMSQDELSSFLTEAKNDEELQDQLDFSKKVFQVTSSRSEKIAMLEKWKDDYVWKDKTENINNTRPHLVNNTSSPLKIQERSHHKTRRHLSLYWITGVAATLIIGIYTIKNTNVSKESDINMSHESVVSSTNAESDNSDILFMLEHEKYEEALLLIKEKSHYLETVLKQERKNDLSKEKKEKSIQVIKNKQDDLKWLEIQTLPNMGQYNATLRLLDELRSTDGKYKMIADSLYKLINYQINIK